MIAKKILPFVMPYTCDSHKTVRDSAFKCIQVGIEKLKQHALTLPDQPLTASQQQQQSSDQQANKGGSVGDMTSYLGSWAKSISASKSVSGDDQAEETKKNSSNQSNGSYGSN